MLTEEWKTLPLVARLRAGTPGMIVDGGFEVDDTLSADAAMAEAADLIERIATDCTKD